MPNISRCNIFPYFKGLEKLIERSLNYCNTTLYLMLAVAKALRLKMIHPSILGCFFLFFTQLYYSEYKSKQQIVAVYHYLVYTF